MPIATDENGDPIRRPYRPPAQPAPAPGPSYGNDASPQPLPRPTGRPNRPARNPAPTGRGQSAADRRFEERIANMNPRQQANARRRRDTPNTPTPPAGGGTQLMTPDHGVQSGPPGGNVPVPPMPSGPSMPGSPGDVFPMLRDPLAPQGGMPPWMQGGGGMPWSGANGGYNIGDFNDPFSSYLSAIPVMEENMTRQISDAMAQAGFTGNRYGTSAQRTAGQIGAETSLEMNRMLTDVLSGQANRDIDRNLQATGMANTAGMSQDQLAQDRLGALTGFGGWEQGRQDAFQQEDYDRFMTQVMGYLPFLGQMASSQGAGNPGQVYQTVTSPGSQPTIPPELLSIIAGMF